MMAFGRFRWLAAAMFAVIVLAAGAMASELPKIAVYVTGDFGGNEKKALETRILVHLVNSGQYSGSERVNSFAAEVDKTLQTHGGNMDDSQISELAKRFGIRFVCVAAVTPVFGEFQVSARIVDAETAGVEHVGMAASPLKSMSDLAEVSEAVVKNMFAGQTAPSAAKPAPAPEPAPISEPPKPEPAAQAPVPTAAAQPSYEPVLPPAATPPPRRGPVKAAVYVTGIPAMVAKPFNSAISSALMKTKIYAGIEPIDVSGTPSTPALAAAGSNAGVSYIFAINVAGTISVAIVDVAESAELAKISIDGKITAVNAAVIAKKIVDFILKSGPKPDPAEQEAAYADAEPAARGGGYAPYEQPSAAGESRNNRVSFGAGWFFANDYGGGLKWSNGEQIGMPYSVNGLYFYFDFIYAEAFIGLSTGGGAWETEDLSWSSSVSMPDMQRTFVNIGALGKLPFGPNGVKFFPLFGFDWELSTYAQLENAGRFGSPSAGDLSSLWFKLGGGMDVATGPNVYLRAEWLYGWRTANDYEQSLAGGSYSGNNRIETRPGNGWTVKSALGVKF